MKKLWLGVLLLCGMVLSLGAAMAADYTWNGNIGTNNASNLGVGIGDTITIGQNAVGLLRLDVNDVTLTGNIGINPPSTGSEIGIDIIINGGKVTFSNLEIWATPLNFTTNRPMITFTPPAPADITVILDGMNNIKKSSDTTNAIAAIASWNANLFFEGSGKAWSNTPSFAKSGGLAIFSETENASSGSHGIAVFSGNLSVTNCYISTHGGIYAFPGVPAGPFLCGSGIYMESLTGSGFGITVNSGRLDAHGGYGRGQSDSGGAGITLKDQTSFIILRSGRLAAEGGTSRNSSQAMAVSMARAIDFVPIPPAEPTELVMAGGGVTKNHAFTKPSGWEFLVSGIDRSTNEPYEARYMDNRIVIPISDNGKIPTVITLVPPLPETAPVPATGDNSKLLFYLGMLGMFAIGLAWSSVRRRTVKK